MKRYVKKFLKMTGHELAPGATAKFRERLSKAAKKRWRESLASRWTNRPFAMEDNALGARSELRSMLRYLAAYGYTRSNPRVV